MNKKILVIGDIILDQYIEGRVDRISPEAPVPVLSSTKSIYRLGGAANVALNLGKLGCSVSILGRIGSDREGSIVKQLLSENKVRIDLLDTLQEIPTILKTRYTSGTQHILRVDREAIPLKEVSEALNSYILEDLHRHLTYFDAVILSDYNKGMITETLLLKIGELNKEVNKIIIADSKKKDLSLFKNFTCITPNKKEFEALCKESLSITCLAGKTKDIIKEHGIKNILVTLSEEGMLVSDNTRSYHISSDKKEVVDVTGAGDTVVSVFTLALCLGYDNLNAMKLANKAAGLVVSKMGTAYCYWEDLFNVNPR